MLLRRCREILKNSPIALRVLKAAMNAAEDGQAGIQVSAVRGVRLKEGLLLCSRFESHVQGEVQGVRNSCVQGAIKSHVRGAIDQLLRESKLRATPSCQVSAI